MALTPHLASLRDGIEQHARDFGLDFFDVVFETVDFDQMNMIASYGGFPVRYPHWKWGMEYDRLSKSYAYGVSKIYELVINNDPSFAYLMVANPDVDQKLVMSHVYGHVDFFKHNFAFAHTNRKMVDTMANHATKIRRYIDRYGVEKVEAFIDRCLSIDNLIDRHAPYIKRRAEDSDVPERDERITDVPKIKTDREYMKGYINPKEYLDSQRKRLEEERERERKFPTHPEFDVLLFLMEHAPLENWERDILSMLRDEAYYFSPQGQTKIMNEGWASYWHTTLMTQKVLDGSEVIDYADRHAGTMATPPGGLNPYKLGIELFRDIEERWDKGRFGKDWEQCSDLAERAVWDTQTGLGREKIFEVRKHYTDVTFVDEFMTADFARKHKLFNFAVNEKSGDWEIETREFDAVKQKLLTQLTNFGQPRIAVVDGNYDNKGTLLLKHYHEGTDLDREKTKLTLQNLGRIWTRTTAIATVYDEKPMLISCEEGEVKESELEEPAA